MTRRVAAGWVTMLAAAAAVGAVVVLDPITRGPGFHHYADQRTWIGIPHVGDVVSNLAFLLAAAYFLRRASTGLPGAPAVVFGVAAIGLGSGIYHWAPSDLTLVLDWGSIAVALMLALAAVIRDRDGAAAGALAFVVGPLAAIGAVVWWLLTGGTHGGNMMPYVAIQLVGVFLPLALALLAPGRIRPVWLAAALAAFLLARLLAAHDADLLDAIGISGHSLKHLAAALAAWFALRSLHPPPA